jgi:hypothetical protein
MKIRADVKAVVDDESMLIGEEAGEPVDPDPVVSTVGAN